MNPKIIHHWDTDGICSTLILLERLGFKAETYVPEIGVYDLRVDEFKLSEGEELILLDYAVPPKTLKLLKSKGFKIKVYDHHVVKRVEGIELYNPHLWGEEYPSTTWVLKEKFSMKTNLLVALGVLGDLGVKATQHECFKEVENALTNAGLSFKEALRATELIDSNYRVCDREGVKRAVCKLKEYINNPRGILTDEEWISKAEIVSLEVEKEVEEGLIDFDRVLFKEMKSKLNIISIVTRKISLMNPKRIIVVLNTGFNPELDQVYVREDGLNLDLTWVIDEANSMGFNAGGKRNTLGIILPKKYSRKFLNHLFKEVRRAYG